MTLLTVSISILDARGNQYLQCGSTLKKVHINVLCSPHQIYLAMCSGRQLLLLLTTYYQFPFSFPSISTEKQVQKKKKKKGNLVLLPVTIGCWLSRFEHQSKHETRLMVMSSTGVSEACTPVLLLNISLVQVIFSRDKVIFIIQQWNWQLSPRFLFILALISLLNKYSIDPSNSFTRAKKPSVIPEAFYDTSRCPPGSKEIKVKLYN